MKVFVAKQPVYNINEEIVGYELFYRNNLTNSFPEIDRDQATAELIINTHLNIGIQRLTKGKQYCVQFTEKLLEKGIPTFFSPEEMIVKISRVVFPSRNLVEIVQKLKGMGYTIALSEWLIKKESPLLIDLLPSINLIAVDFSKQLTKWHEEIEEMAAKHGIKLLAEKIETSAQYEQAKKRGYALFQGYFLSKPVIHSTFEIPTVQPSILLLNQHEIDQLNEDELVDIIEKDLSASIKLLRLINTTALKEHTVCSIREAVSLIGIDEVQKWIYLLSVRSTFNSETRLTDDINRLTLTRAKFCENIGKVTGSPDPSGFYLIGLISTIEKISSVSMNVILEELPISEDIYQALLGTENEYKLVLDLVLAVEQANWKEISDACKKLKINEREIFRLYAESLNWTNEMVLIKMAQEYKDPLLLH